MRDEARQYLLDYLQEEFSREHFIRVRIVPMTKDDGIMVRTESREYFFPFEWAEQHRFDEVARLVSKIKEIYG